MNIADRLSYWANKTPTKDAIRFYNKQLDGSYKYKRKSFEELDLLANKYAFYFNQYGIKKGMKTLLFIRPSLNFPAVVFALFKLGAIPIMIDPGMGKKNLLGAVREVGPEAMIAEPEVFVFKTLSSAPFKTIKVSITAGNLAFGKAKSLKGIAKKKNATFKTERIGLDQTAAILFTSGGTGVPKGVVYTHRIFNEQTELLQKLLNLTPADVDIPGFPLFSLFAIAMGMTSCPPDMNPSKPSKCNPANLIKNITDNKGTFVAGSPAIWERVADYAIKNNLTLDTIKYLVMFGAPVSGVLHNKFRKILPNGDTYTPYGATESLPVSCISGTEVLNETLPKTLEGLGTCVGTPLDSISVKIIKISDDVIIDLRDVEELPQGEIGEIIVSGDVVTHKYYKRPEHTALAKIYETTADGQRVWHRIGDLGYLDSKGSIWFCGRKTHRIEIGKKLLCPVCCEAVFNQHPKVKRTALIDYKGAPTLVIEVKTKKISSEEKKALEKELLSLGSKAENTKEISTFLYYQNFPVDIRHNIKIDRIKLRDFFNEV